VKILSLLADHLKHTSAHLEDIILIALQEIPPSTATFHEDALAIISKPLHQTHITYLSYRVWSQMVFLLMRKSHTCFTTEPMIRFVSSSTLTKPMRTKGAIGVCLRIYQRWTIIIACHLTHSSALQRIQDYHKIMKNLKFSTLCSFTGNDGILHADCVLWMGDLNFRITKDSGIQWNSHPHGLSSSDIENIIKSDELAIIRKKELAFTAFSEAPIKFAPTYKFEIGTNNYVADRIPSYTDRILFWTKQTSWLECTSYNSIHKESQSDHRPVYATF
ncbi:hypothetical protein Angca_008963, partial [Angiostrongylus cantonensis]